MHFMFWILKAMEVENVRTEIGTGYQGFYAPKHPTPVRKLSLKQLDSHILTQLSCGIYTMAKI
jgi:hypothetical protein